MAIELIDKIKQKNGGTFKLVDSEDVAYGDSSVEEEIKNVSKKIQEVASTGTTTEVVQEKVKEMAEQGLIQSYAVGKRTIGENKTTFFNYHEQFFQKLNWKANKYYQLDGANNIREVDAESYQVHPPILMDAGTYYVSSESKEGYKKQNIASIFSFIKNYRTGEVTRLSDIVGKNDYCGAFTVEEKSYVYVTGHNVINIKLSDIDLSESDYIEGVFDTEILADNVSRMENDIAELCKKEPLNKYSVRTTHIGNHQVTVEKTNFIERNKRQFLVDSNFINGTYYWWAEGFSIPQISNHEDYKAYPKLSLPAGTYHFTTIPVFTFIVNQETGVVVRIEDIAVGDKFSVDYDFDIYTTGSNYSNNHMLANGELPSQYVEGVYDTDTYVCGYNLTKFERLKDNFVKTNNTQFLKDEQFVEATYYWWAEGFSTPQIGNHADYKTYPKMSLPAGEYYFTTIPVFTFIENPVTGEIVRMINVAEENKFRVDYDFNLYTTGSSCVNNHMLTDGILPAEYVEGEYNVDVSVYGYSLTNMNEDIENLSKSLEDLTTGNDGVSTISYSRLKDTNVNNLFLSFEGFNTALSNPNSVENVGNMQGLITNEFKANTNALTLKIKGHHTCDLISVLIVYYNGTDWIYSGIYSIHDKQIDHTITVDASNYAVYHKAQKFKFLIINEAQTLGDIVITDISIEDLDDMRSSAMYDKDFIEMTKKTFKQINQNTSQINRLDLKTPVLVNPNGDKYTLSVDINGNLSAIPNIPNNAFVMGNSLVFGMGTFGMCALDSKHDFYYYVKEAILEKNPDATFGKTTIAMFEQCESDTDSKNEINKIKSKLSSNLDLVIIQIGDNVNNAIRRQVFSDNFKNLITAIRTVSPRTRIICVGCWYDSIVELNNPKQVIINTCKAYGCEFVDISYLHTPATEATVGDIITYDDGRTEPVPDIWATHPGNSGMKLIADEIISAINM